MHKLTCTAKRRGTSTTEHSTHLLSPFTNLSTKYLPTSGRSSARAAVLHTIVETSQQRQQAYEESNGLQATNSRPHIANSPKPSAAYAAGRINALITRARDQVFASDLAACRNNSAPLSFTSCSFARVAILQRRARALSTLSRDQPQVHRWMSASGDFDLHRLHSSARSPDERVPAGHASAAAAAPPSSWLASQSGALSGAP